MTVVRDGGDPTALAEAAALLARGELVAFPTETVYGLGADARRADAAQRIYAAKGRPRTNPLIVHVRDAAQAAAWALGWDDRAAALAAAFWPGPLTLVVDRGPGIPPEVTGGGDTLALRVPRHPVAQALLARFGGPIAAPSANRSTAISPTRAEHVRDELTGRVPLILDGGPCEVGLESTVLSLVGAARILRPGRIGLTELASVLGTPIDQGPLRGIDAAAPLPSPGLLERHYAPRTPVVLAPRDQVEGEAPTDAAFLVTAALDRPRARVLPPDPVGYARALYDALRWADQQGAPAIWVERPPVGEAWEAVHDRLRRAATPASPRRPGQGE